MPYSNVFMYLRGYLRGRQDAIEGKPAQTSLAGDFAIGYQLAYRCFTQHTVKTWRTPA
jgi:hypothetical protein